jgi:hypothetical protein
MQEAQSDTEMELSNQVLDDIMETSDLALLASVCRTQLNLGQEDAIPVPKDIKSISADEFLKKVGVMDLEKVIGAKEEWLFHTSEHLESLLSDMLDAREFKHDTNDVDCY